MPGLSIVFPLNVSLNHCTGPSCASAHRSRSGNWLAWHWSLWLTRR